MNKVECYAGSKYPERPTAFESALGQFEVESILSQWRFPDSIGFRVKTTTADFFELIYREADDAWDIIEVRDTD